jgi:hypothetical protein
MDFLEHVLVFLHLIGLAAVLGGFLVQIKSPERKILPVQWHGILTQVVTGVLLAGVVPQIDDVEGVFYAKITTKLVLALVALVLIAANRRRESVTTGVWAAIGVIEMVNIAVALFWTL